MTAAAVVSVALAHLLAAMSPGPSFVVALRIAARDGFRPAARLAAGLGAGAAIWAVAALTGLSVLFQVAPAALTLLKLAGAAFLVWLAVTMWRQADRPMATASTGMPRSAAAAFRLGLTTQLANPKPAVFFGAVFVGLVPPAAPLAAKAGLIAVIFVNETLWYIAVARVFSAARARAAYGQLKAWIDRAFGAVLAALAGRLVIG